jgi:hypothetical protein
MDASSIENALRAERAYAQSEAMTASDRMNALRIRHPTLNPDLIRPLPVRVPKNPTSEAAAALVALSAPRLAGKKRYTHRYSLNRAQLAFLTVHNAPDTMKFENFLMSNTSKEVYVEFLSKHSNVTLEKIMICNVCKSKHNINVSLLKEDNKETLKTMFSCGDKMVEIVDTLESDI